MRQYILIYRWRYTMGDDIKYLGRPICILRFHTFNCLLANHRESFYWSTNAIFGKIGRMASEKVVLQLIKNKCIPTLLYGVEACALIKSELSSLDFVVNNFFMKLFRTNNTGRSSGLAKGPAGCSHSKIARVCAYWVNVICCWLVCSLSAWRK